MFVELLVTDIANALFSRRYTYSFIFRTYLNVQNAQCVAVTLAQMPKSKRRNGASSSDTSRMPAATHAPQMAGYQHSQASRVCNRASSHTPRATLRWGLGVIETVILMMLFGVLDESSKSKDPYRRQIKMKMSLSKDYISMRNLSVSATALGVGLVGPSRVRPRVRAEKSHLGRWLTIRVYAISLEHQTGR